MDTQQALDLAREHFAAVAKIDITDAPMETIAARKEAIDFWKIVIDALKRRGKKK